MYVVLGATGHVGSQAAHALLEQGQAVTVITRDASKGERWKRRGADVAAVFSRGTVTLDEHVSALADKDRQ